MEDQVPFKVFTFWSENSKPEVRRFGVDKSVVTSFAYLSAKLQDLFPGLRDKPYTVSWEDEEGDDVAVSSDDEMMVVLTNMTHNMVKLNIRVKNDNDDSDGQNNIFFAPFVTSAAPVTDDEETPLTGMPHAGVVCDSCEGPVIGFRYKCATCPDYDLCAKCESAGRHAEHCMVRVPMPLMPRALIKAAIKRSRHIFKTVAVGDECPYKKHKRDKSGDRKHRREHHGEHRDRRERRPRASWLDTFATYMNEFANLAGDVDCHPPQPSDVTNPNAAQQPTDVKPTSSDDVTEAPPQPTTSMPTNGEIKQEVNGGGKPDTTKPELHLEKILNPDNVKYLLDLQKTLTSILIPNLLPQAPKAAATPPPTPANDVEMGQGDRKAPSPDKVSVKSDVSSTSNEEKADGWTVINKESGEYMMEAAKPSSSAGEPLVNIGFDLPEEFQRRVSINPAQALYPPLHAAAAVLDPVTSVPVAQTSQAPSAPTEAKAAAAAEPKAQTQPQAAAQPQPRARHPKPHIEAAIQHMLAMGFNNDSGWLTQLLETKDGNISAVLDLLTPVSAQKK